MIGDHDPVNLRERMKQATVIEQEPVPCIPVPEPELEPCTTNPDDELRALLTSTPDDELRNLITRT